MFDIYKVESRRNFRFILHYLGLYLVTSFTNYKTDRVFNVGKIALIVFQLEQ